MKIKDNPCRKCPKANMEFVGDLEYGCFNPCQQAEDYFADIGKKIDDLLKRADQLLKGGE